MRVSLPNLSGFEITDTASNVKCSFQWISNFTK